MKDPATFRSARWFAPDDLRAFGHRSRFMQMGYGPDDWAGKPVIAILNTWSDVNQCHAHFKHRVEDVIWWKGIGILLVSRWGIRGSHLLTEKLQGENPEQQ